MNKFPTLTVGKNTGLQELSNFTKEVGTKARIRGREETMPNGEKVTVLYVRDSSVGGRLARVVERMVGVFGHSIAQRPRELALAAVGMVIGKVHDVKKENPIPKAAFDVLKDTAHDIRASALQGPLSEINSDINEKVERVYAELVEHNSEALDEKPDNWSDAFFRDSNLHEFLNGGVSGGKGTSHCINAMKRFIETGSTNSKWKMPNETDLIHGFAERWSAAKLRAPAFLVEKSAAKKFIDELVTNIMPPVPLLGDYFDSKEFIEIAEKLKSPLPRNAKAKDRPLGAVSLDNLVEKLHSQVKERLFHEAKLKQLNPAIRILKANLASSIRAQEELKFDLTSLPAGDERELVLAKMDATKMKDELARVRKTALEKYTGIALLQQLKTKNYTENHASSPDTYKEKDAEINGRIAAADRQIAALDAEADDLASKIKLMEQLDKEKTRESKNSAGIKNAEEDVNGIESTLTGPPNLSVLMTMLEVGFTKRGIASDNEHLQNLLKLVETQMKAERSLPADDGAS